MPVTPGVEQTDGAMCQFLQRREWVINLEEYDATLPDGARVRVDTKVDERTLRRVLKVLREHPRLRAVDSLSLPPDTPPVLHAEK